MPPQATGTLKHQINRREISGDQVEIEIEALLGNLGSDKNFSANALAVCAKNFECMILAFLPPVCREARMEQQDFRAVRQTLADTLAFTRQRFAQGITDTGLAPAARY